MRRVVLKLIVPIVLLFVMVGVACYVYYRDLEENATMDELFIMADDISEELYSADMLLKSVMDYQEHAALVSKHLNFYTDKKNIEEQLSFISKTEDVIVTLVCNSTGDGYNSKGETVSLKSEEFFDIVKSSYSKGGSGLISIVNSEKYPDRPIAIVNQVSFMDQVDGYLISIMSLRSFPEKVFKSKHKFAKAAVVSLGGNIIAESKDSEDYTGEYADNFWDDVPENLPVENIKLNISRKTKYVAEVEDFGYVVVAPSKVTQGAAILFLNKSDFAQEMRMKLYGYKKFVRGLFFVLVTFVLSMLIINFADKQIRLRLVEKLTMENGADKLTGLYNKQGLIEEVGKYTQASNPKQGLIFAVYIDSFSKIRQGIGDEAADMAIMDFAKKLSQNYRVSDVIGKLSDDEYIIFLKDIVTDKDIRKQVDELQMLLYDIRSEEMDKGLKLTSTVGAAVFPNDAKTPERLLECALETLETARLEGRGRISFYK